MESVCLCVFSPKFMFKFSFLEIYICSAHRREKLRPRISTPPNRWDRRRGSFVYLGSAHLAYVRLYSRLLPGALLVPMKFQMCFCICAFVPGRKKNHPCFWDERILCVFSYLNARQILYLPSVGFLFLINTEYVLCITLQFHSSTTLLGYVCFLLLQGASAALQGGAPTPPSPSLSFDIFPSKSA